MQDMTVHDIDRMLSEARIGRLSMADAAGRPYTIPLPFCWTDGSIYLRLPLTGRKGAVLAQNDQVCFEVDQFTETLDAYASVLVEGRLVSVASAAEKLRVKRSNDEKYSRLRHGYRPGHGRAPLHPDVLGPMGPPPTREFIEWLFTPPFDGEGSHPTAHLHTQWPGTREPDDPVLDQFWAGTGPMPADFGVAHALEGARLAELLDRVGPAVVVTHSAGGPCGWVAADRRPDRVAALVAIETMGPPFVRNPAMGLSLDWGLAAAPLAYDPPAAAPSELELVTRELGDGRPPMTLQAEPPRSLPNLAGFPIAVVTAEASMFVPQFVTSWTTEARSFSRRRRIFCVVISVVSTSTLIGPSALSRSRSET